MADPASTIPPALYRDPPRDPAAPARTSAQAIPSGGVNLNTVLYIASGAGPHPTLLLLHGLPGNEQNLDLAQAVRRAGWNVLTLHYRGSWGSPGAFSFKHCLEDAVAAMRWLHDGDRDPALRIDKDRLAVAGHSMGGFVAVHVAASIPAVLGIALISGVDLGRSFGMRDQEHAAAVVDDNVGTRAGLHILAGTSPKELAEEARVNADRWRLATYAPVLAARPSLLITSDDGFAAAGDALAEAAQGIDGCCLTRAHFSTDHSYSDCRIALQVELLGWLVQLNGACLV